MSALAVRFAHWPEDMRPRRGAFEVCIAFPDGVDQFGATKMRPGYESRKCWLVGPIALHRDGDDGWPWVMSHADSGLLLPCAYGRDLEEAASVARAIAGAIDWTAVKRSATPGVVAGMTKEMGQAISAMIYSFRQLRPFVDAMRTSV